jgi:hypothetical protein
VLAASRRSSSEEARLCRSGPQSGASRACFRRRARHGRLRRHIERIPGGTRKASLFTLKNAHSALTLQLGAPELDVWSNFWTTRQSSHSVWARPMAYGVHATLGSAGVNSALHGVTASPTAPDKVQDLTAQRIIGCVELVNHRKVVVQLLKCGTSTRRLSKRRCLGPGRRWALTPKHQAWRRVRPGSASRQDPICP